MTKVAINAEVVNGQCCVPICDSIAVSFLLCLGVHSLFSYLFNVLFFTFNAMAKEGLTSMNANSKDTLQYKRYTLRQMADKWQSYFVWYSILCFLTCSMFCSLITFNAMAKEGLTSMNANSKDTLVTVTRDMCTLRQMADK